MNANACPVSQAIAAVDAAEVDRYFARVVLPGAAASRDAEELVEWMERQADEWDVDAGREDGDPHAADIAAFLE
jgi:hypothetical protein